jgi:hypothetical protein
MLKTFLLWFLMATLPLQGVAATAKALCSEQPSGNTTAFMFHAAHGIPAASALSLHSHDMVLSMASDDKHMHEQAGSERHSQQHHKHTVCGVCASCCIGATAPPLALASMSPQVDVQSVSILPSLLMASFIAAGLDRPPKPVIA